MRKHHPKSQLIKRNHPAFIKEPTASLLDEAEATALTQRIRTAVEGVRDMLLEAHDRQAWMALGYNSWSAYVRSELDMGRAHSYRLLDHGRVIKAIEDATGKVSPMGDISERTARELKSDLLGAIEEIKARSERGKDPAQSAKEIAAERKAAKEKDKAEKDAEKADKETPRDEYNHQRDEYRAKLPAIKQQQVATEAAIEAREANPDDGLIKPTGSPSSRKRCGRWRRRTHPSRLRTPPKSRKFACWKPASTVNLALQNIGKPKPSGTGGQTTR